MFPAYWILITSGESSESVMRVLVIQLKLFFPNLKDKVSEFVNSCEACQHVKAGNKFDRGGEKLKLVPVPYQTMNQLDIDLVTNLPSTREGYNTIITAVD